MKFTRGSGILLHPTSLPGPDGSGDIGSEAESFLSWLASAGQTYWQVLPLGPGGYGNSPYSSLSAFAANPLLISLARLVERGWLPASSLAQRPAFPSRKIDFHASSLHRMRLLREAASAFFARGAPADRKSFETYRQEESSWLPDYALFMALNEVNEGREWSSWDRAVAQRDPAALNSARSQLGELVRLHEFTQWVFSQQWSALRQIAASHKIKLIGDIPIFVAHHSADVWSHRELFYLDKNGVPDVVAGVPPDYFSVTGQRWGNPLYRWDVIAKTGYSWWIERVRSLLKTVDIARIDHFRGFAGYWEIPASEPTAVNGRWVTGPGAALFEAIQKTLGKDLPIIAEDLGLITADVVALRDQFELPGMKILQFAFGSGPENAFLPHNYLPHSVVYTGTHDNDTTLGWFQTAPEAERVYMRKYIGEVKDVAWDLIRVAAASVADMAIVPFQDVLGLNSEGRMNRPGLASDNWDWRFQWDEVSTAAAPRLAEIMGTYGRTPK
jgi:4-alpha-glucanotransferase